MKSLPFWFVALATLFALVGMGFGVYMSISQNHELAGAHAHNNLIGFVAMTIYGFYYKLVPAAATTTLARVHFWIALIGSLTFGPGIGMAILGQGEILVQVSTLFVIGSMAIFSWTVLTNRSGLSV